MQQFQSFASGERTSTKAWQLRTVPCIHLPTGDHVGAFVQTAHKFEDQVSGFLTEAVQQHIKMGDWLYDQITTLEVHCHSLDMVTRPLVLPIPDASLNAISVALEACVHAVAQTRFCPQELSVELSGSSTITSPHRASEFIHAFRRNGFRVSIDARHHWQLDLSPAMWLLVDTLRIDARHLDTSVDLQVIVETAADAGVVIVAENSKWRDADYLERLGVLYALSPKADA